MSDPLTDPTRARSASAPTPEPHTAAASGTPEPRFDAALGHEPDSGPPLRPPAHPGDLGRLGRYRVLKRLGAGGMGAVYLAFDDGLRRRLALKVMLPRYAAHPAARHRFLREARTAASVRSPHVVAIHDVDENGGTPFIAMEYLQGTPLDRFLKGAPALTVPQVVRIGRETAAGLAAAHAAGLVHRDVKPGNLWLQAPDGRVKLLDFGLAREEDGGDTLTHTGDVVGTPAYMSPEQARGERVDHRTDLFSLGVLLYRLTTGRLPFTGPTAMAVLTSLAVDDPPPVRALNPAVPEALAALVHRLLEKNPADRPQSADEVCAALAALGGAVTPGFPVGAPIAVAPQAEDVWEGIDATPAEAATPHAPAARKRRGFPWLAAGGAAAAVLVAGLLVAAVFNRQPPPPDPPAAKGEPEAPKPTPPKPAPTADPDRRAAEALHPHCLLRLLVAGKEVSVPPKDALPTEPYKVTEVNVEHLTSPNRDAFLAAVADLRDLRKLDDGYRRLALAEADVARFAAMPFADRLGTLGVPGVELTPAVVAELARFKQLTNLTIKAEAADDAVLKQLARTLPGLRSLLLIGLGRSGRVTADGFAAVAALPLQTLWLNDCPAVTREWGAHIGRMPGVQRLVLNNCYADDDVLAELVACKQLTSLTCTGAATKVTNDGMKAVARMPLLQTLDVDGLPIGDTGLGHLHALTKLKSLIVVRTDVTMSGMLAFHAALPECGIKAGKEKYDPKLDPDRVAAEWVLEKGGTVTLAGPVWVKKADTLPAGFLRVTELALPAGMHELTDADLDRLAPLTGLTTLALESRELTDRGLEKLSQFPAAKTLTSLSLAAPKLTDDGLKPLARFRALTKLTLGYTTVSGKGFAVLRELRALTHLYLGSSKVGDEGLLHLRGLEPLHFIDLRLSNATDAGVEALAHVPKLTTLGLTGTSVTDLSLEHLARAKQLTLLQLQGTQVTREGVAAFKKAVPGCEVKSNFDAKP